VDDQLLVFIVLGLALGMFLWGRWRYDLVALSALLILVVSGVIDSAEAFLGFGHPAVITVAAVLVISAGLERSGLVGAIAERLSDLAGRRTVLVPVMTIAIAVASAFMNNIGALALFMPVAIQLTRESDQSPSQLLMPLAFGSLLGGLLTLIATPSNIIIATFRERDEGEAFRMFDFLPAGSVVALAGLLLLAVGWRLVPQRRTSSDADAMFEVEDYLTELTVPSGSSLVGSRLSSLRTDREVVVVGIIRDGEQMETTSGFEIVREGDRIVVEVDGGALESLLDDFGLELAGDTSETVQVDALSLIEAVVAPGSRTAGRTPADLGLPSRYGVNILAVSRRGQALRQRPVRVRLRAGDVVLLQGARDDVRDAIEDLGCLPLAPRSWRIGRPRRLIFATAVFAAGLVVTAFGLLPVQVALSAAAVIIVLGGALRLDEAYEAIDWPIIVLIAAMLPVGEALETTGGAAAISALLETLAGGLTDMWIIAVLVGVVMLLSNVINNAAAAVVMAPVAVGLAQAQGASIDPFLMAVAIGAAVPVLTPIGHQSNVLVMGPGGFRFGDYWRLGVPLSVVVCAVAPFAIVWFWPLH
jgi:di/tricarboxylate transporter